MSKRRIKLLIISFQTTDRILIRELLDQNTEIEFSLSESGSGSQGLEICRQESPDCILLDGALSAEETDNILRQLNPDPLNPRFPIVWLTKFTDQSEAREILTKGVQDYLIKENLTAREIERAVLNSIEKVELRRELRQSVVIANQFKTLIEHARDVIFFIRPDDAKFVRVPAFLHAR